VRGFDGFVVVTGEYNHGPASAVKNAFDYLYAEWHDKPVGFVSYGSAGGARAVEQLRLVAIELRLAPVAAQVTLPIATCRSRPTSRAIPTSLRRRVGTTS
jgi:NAD(P)H-dependent FMN reductase